jgi:hypothetical protein
VQGILSPRLKNSSENYTSCMKTIFSILSWMKAVGLSKIYSFLIKRDGRLKPIAKFFGSRIEGGIIMPTQ